MRFHFDSRLTPTFGIRTPDDVPAALADQPEPVSLPALPIRDDRCDDCLYPATCAADRTCWKAVSFERTVNRVTTTVYWDAAAITAALRAFAARHDGVGPKLADLRERDLPSQQTILRTFGSLRAACLAAGVEVPKRRRSFNRGSYEDRSLDVPPDEA